MCGGGHSLKLKSLVEAVVIHAYNPSTQEVDAGGSRVRGQPGLHEETLCQKKSKNNQTNKTPNKFSKPSGKGRITTSIISFYFIL
jgi:hypothetical protein